MKYIKIFEDFTDESPKSKRQIKSEIWHKNNPSPEGKVLKVEDLPQFGIPESIIEMMKEWEIIYYLLTALWI